MKLEELKIKATTSELTLISVVEDMVRSEYDLETMKKGVHNDLKNEIYSQVSTVLKNHGLLNGYGSINRWDEPYIKGILYDIGDAVMLKLKP